MARESVYTAGYLGLCPILRDALEQHPAMQVRADPVACFMQGPTWDANGCGDMQQQRATSTGSWLCTLA
jgi:hypothetical protein